MMKIEVKLHGTLRRHRPTDAAGAPHHPFALSVPDGVTVAHVVDQLGIETGLLNAAAVNGDSVNLDSVLHEGDSVQLFPPSAGG